MSGSEQFETGKPVSLIDRFYVLPGNQQAVFELMTGEYAAHVAPRGLKLAGSWVSPPFEQRGLGSEITIVWEYPTLGALWASRMAEEDDPVARSVWERIGALTESRSRQLARTAPMQLAPPDDAGTVSTAKETAKRSILFVRPREKLSEAERKLWIGAVEQAALDVPGLLTSRAGFHQEYSFMPEHFTWDVSVSAPVGQAALLAALPGPAEIVDAVELGEVLDAGLRDLKQQGTKRTILIRLKAGLSENVRADFEAVMAASPHYITGIHNWRFSRVAAAQGAVKWSYCIEQEVPDPAIFVGDYLNHPYHWAVIERLFHPDAPERVADGFCHTLYPINRSVLAAL